MIFRTLKEGELDAWCAHCQEVFTQTPDGYFKRHYLCDPDADPELVFIAEDNGQIVSTVRVFRRTVRIGGHCYSMGGIGEVSTKPAYQGQGLASALLKTAIETMKKEGMAISILFGSKNIYSKAGYRKISVNYTTADAERLPVLPSGAVLRPFEIGDLNAVMGIYDLYAGRIDSALYRSEEYWKRWVLPQWGHVWVLEMENHTAAYCEIQSDGRVSEMGAAPQFEEYLPALIGGAAQKEQARSVMFQTSILPQVQGVQEERALYMAMDLAQNEPLVTPGFFSVDDF